MDNFSLSSQQLVPNYCLYPSKSSDVHRPIITLPRLAPIFSGFLAIVVVEKTECRKLLEVHRNVIDVESIAFLMILLAPEVSFVILHMRWHKGCFPKASTTSETISDSAQCSSGLSMASQAWQKWVELKITYRVSVIDMWDWEITVRDWKITTWD